MMIPPPDAPPRLTAVRTELEATARRAGRNPQDVNLIAVSKMQGIDAIRPLLQAGHRHFGENRVQEAQAKWPQLRAEFPDVVLHLIGSLQTNKAEDAVALFDQIHTLDRLTLAEALTKAMARQGRRVPCFIQVNTGEEPQKGGVVPHALPMLIDAARTENLPLTGLMVLPPVADNPAPHFALLAKLAARHQLARLSMGMSGDAAMAISLGATDVRIGTAIFGERSATN